MAKGKIKFFNTTKGFGFIEGDDGKEYFVHISKFPSGTNQFDIQKGQKVIFNSENTDRGLQAVDVTFAGNENFG